MKRTLRKVYGKCYEISPNCLRNILSKAVFALTNKPFVNKSDVPLMKRFPGGYKGGLIISADFELGWAFRYSKRGAYPEKMANQTRENFPYFIKMFEDYEIPITWATVGHLMLSECKKGDHDWMHRIPYFENKHWIYNKGDWFDCDPYTNWKKAKTWYAPDLIEKILNSKVKHEIGCHTFTHIDFSDKNCPLEVAEDEIKACIEAAKKWNITLKSMVFPGGTYGNYEVLKKYGFTNYRKKMEYDLSYPELDRHGLIILPSSRGLGNNGLGWSQEYFFSLFKKYIDKAVSTYTVCHFWFHPSIDIWFLHNVFPRILKYAAELRNKNLLWIETMGNIAEFVRKIERKNLCQELLVL